MFFKQPLAFPRSAKYFKCVYFPVKNQQMVERKHFFMNLEKKKKTFHHNSCVFDGAMCTNILLNKLCQKKGGGRGVCAATSRTEPLLASDSQVATS